MQSVNMYSNSQINFVDNQTYSKLRNLRIKIPYRRIMVQN